MSESRPRPFLIEICGGIASGKTTLARLTASIGLAPVLEQFELNPFWQAFYADPVGNAFEAELTFLLQHYHAMKHARRATSAVACDFSLELDVAYARVNLGQARLGIFQSLYAEVRSELGAPDLLIHLRCAPEIQLERIRRRARPPESAIELTYLHALASQIDAVVRDTNAANTLVIDSGVTDFASDREGQERTLRDIRAAIRSST